MNAYTRLYIQAWVVVMVLFVVFMAAFASGKGSLRFIGSTIHLNQYTTYRLYKINESLAFEIGNGHVSLVNYETTSGLYGIAGDYQHAPNEGTNIFMVSADYRKDDYVYSTYPMGKTTIVNLKTGEVVGKLVEANPITDLDFAPVDASQLPAYRQRGLVFDDQYKLTIEKIIAQYEQLNTYDENLFVVEMAFICVFVILIFFGIPILISRYKNAR